MAPKTKKQVEQSTPVTPKKEDKKLVEYINEIEKKDDISHKITEPSFSTIKDLERWDKGFEQYILRDKSQSNDSLDIIIGFDLSAGSRLLSNIFTSVNSQNVSFKIAFDALIFLLSFSCP